MMEIALQKMIEAGLEVKDYSHAKFQLWVLDRKTSSSRETLRLFLAYMRADPALVEVGMQAMYGKLPAKLKVKPMKGAKKLLEELRAKYKLALVTGGVPSFQKEKWENAGIDSSLFSTIAVANDCEKKIHYQEILKQIQTSPLRTIVVGDRIGRDLLPAKELGCTTVQIKWGRGLQYENHRGAVDFVISELAEIKKILQHLETLSADKINL